MDPLAELGFELVREHAQRERWSNDPITNEVRKTETREFGWVIHLADGTRRWASPTEIMLWFLVKGLN